MSIFYRKNNKQIIINKKACPNPPGAAPLAGQPARLNFMYVHLPLCTYVIRYVVYTGLVGYPGTKI